MEQFVYSPKSLGSAIKRQRKAKKLTQTEVGRSFKIEQSTVSAIEQGVPGTRLETLFRMLAALELEIVVRSKKSTRDKAKGDW
jgi:HTH-type transcriptional regulator/antitoxin HipB